MPGRGDDKEALTHPVARAEIGPAASALASGDQRPISSSTRRAQDDLPGLSRRFGRWVDPNSRGTIAPLSRRLASLAEGLSVAPANLHAHAVR